MRYKLNKTDIYLLILFYIIGISVTLASYDLSTELNEALIDTVIYVVFSFLIAYVIVFILFPYYFPQNKLIQLFLWTGLLMAVAGVIELYLYRWSEGTHIAFGTKYFKTFKLWLWGIQSSAENAGILIGVFLGKKFYDAQVYIQKREKEKKENELRLLKSQIDPHFLFNNLNTVDALIDSDPIIAKQYLQKLSQLYRYLIRTKDDEVVLLEDEMGFARNYIYLIERRFGKAYQFNIEGKENISDQLIPPGALQTLLENVVKHNLSTNDSPITTEIIIDKKQVIISNDLRLKPNVKTSNKTGLANLKARYALLSEEKIEITTDNRYTVTLPLIHQID
jgi:hypothetical protein